MADKTWIFGFGTQIEHVPPQENICLKI